MTSSLLLTIVLLQAAAATSVPVPHPGNAMPPFPQAAREQQVEGPIEFELQIDEKGKVTQVKILRVPQTGVGFEAVAEKTLLAWRFAPATRDGQPVPFTYPGKVEMTFAFAGHRARLYPKRTFDEVWHAVESVVGAMGFESYGGDPQQGVLVTPTTNVKGEAVQLHVFVPPWARPVRVYVDSVRDDRGHGGSPDIRRFDLPKIGQEFFTRLAAALGDPGQPMPQMFKRRVELAERQLGPADPALACMRRAMANPPPAGDPRIQAPVAISEFQQGAILIAGKRSPFAKPMEVVIEGEVAEDGRFRPDRIVEGERLDQKLVGVTLATAAMWRFRPAMIDGCPVPVKQQMKSTFRPQ